MLSLRSGATIAYCAVFAGLLVGAAQAQEAGNVFDATVQDAPHLEPDIPRPAQEDEALGKLAALAKARGRKPNILIFLVDDMGWGDIGASAHPSTELGLAKP